MTMDLSIYTLGLQDVAVQVLGANPRLFPRMTVKFTFSFGLAKDTVQLLAVTMEKMEPPYLMGFCCSGTCC